jgi:predicted nucleotidyltransferase
MTAATARLRGLARRITDVYAAHMPVRAALLAGSGARGDADEFSDLDLLLYGDEVPPYDAAAAAQRELGAGEAVVLLPHGEQGFLDQFPLDGVQCQVGLLPIRDLEADLDQLLDRHEGLDTPLAKIATGLLEGVPLLGEEVVAAWRERVAAYPESLRRAMVAHWWRFFPFWYHERALASRDAFLWRQEELVNAAYAIIGTLAGVNRLYFARFEFKRERAFLAKMTHAPERLAERLESLVALPHDAAVAELESLLRETQAIVERELPGVDVSLRRPPGARVEPWPV